MKVAILKSPTLPEFETDETRDADAVVHLSFGRNPELAEHETVAEIMVLRSRFGDPFTRAVLLDLAHVDPVTAAARESVRADEVAKALETLRRHGVLTHAGPREVLPPPPRRPLTKPKILDGADEGSGASQPKEPIGFRPPAKSQEYDGTPCGSCGQLLVIRTGTCRTCQGCGANDGC